MYTFDSSKRYLLSILLLVAYVSFGQSDIFKVTLDAGHGAHDFGAAYSGRVEKKINLALVLKIGAILEKNPKIKVIYTRKTDVFIDLAERANIANRSDSHIFVSIHCNANINTEAYGTETYVMGMSKVASNLEAAKKENSVITLEKDFKENYAGFNPNSPETMIGMTLMQEEYIENSIALASKIQDGFAALGKKVRQEGVKQAPFLVLHKAYMPRVLVETGFVSNPTEGEILNSEQGQNEIAETIANAITSYKREYFGADITDKYTPIKPVETLVKDTTTLVETKTEPVIIKNPNSVLFKVQLSASKKKLELLSKNFKGLKNISRSREGSYYKYIYGETDNYDEAIKLLDEAKSKGYKSAFLLAFKNGLPIDIQKALQ